MFTDVCIFHFVSCISVNSLVCMGLVSHHALIWFCQKLEFCCTCTRSCILSLLNFRFFLHICNSVCNVLLLSAPPCAALNSSLVYLYLSNQHGSVVKYYDFPSRCNSSTPKSTIMCCHCNQSYSLMVVSICMPHALMAADIACFLLWPAMIICLEASYSPQKSGNLVFIHFLILILVFVSLPFWN